MSDTCVSPPLPSSGSNIFLNMSFSLPLTSECQGQQLPPEFMSALVKYLFDARDELNQDLAMRAVMGNHDEDAEEEDHLVWLDTINTLTLTSRFFLEQVRKLRYAEFVARSSTPYDEDKPWYDQLDLYQYVDSLEIHGFSDCVEEIYSVEMASYDHHWMRKLTPFVEKFTNVQKVKILCLDWGSIDRNLRTALLDRFRKARWIVLNGIDYRSSNQMARVFESFPNDLDVLGLSFSRCRSLNHTTRQLLNIKPLNAKECYINFTEKGNMPHPIFVRLLSGARSGFTSRYVQIHWPEAELSSAMDLLRLLAPSLHDLLIWFDRQGKFSCSLSLHLTQIQCFTV